MQKFKKKSISTQIKMFGLILIFLISLGFAIPLNFSLNFDNNNLVYKELRLQITNYSYCVEWFKTWDFSYYVSWGLDQDGNEIRENFYEHSRLIAASQDGNYIIEVVIMDTVVLERLKDTHLL